MSNIDKKLIGALADKMAEGIAHKVAIRILENADDIISETLKAHGASLEELPSSILETIKSKAFPLSVLMFQESSEITPVMFAATEDYFVACGVNDMKADDGPAQSTIKVVNKVVSLRDNGPDEARKPCNCANCQRKRTALKEAEKASKESGPSVNEATTAAILQEIEAEGALND